MSSEEQDQESPRKSNRSSHVVHGRSSNHDRDDTEDNRYSVFSSAMSTGSDDDDESSKGSNKSVGQTTRPSQFYQHHEKHAHGPLEEEHRYSVTSNLTGDPHHHGHVHFKEKSSGTTVHHNDHHLPPLTNAGVAPSTYSINDQDLSRASWTTASFSEIPNALDELTHQHNYPTKSFLTKEQHVPIYMKDKKSSVERSSAGDLHSILIKHGQPSQILTKYLRPTMLDEETQAGIPSWDWLTRLEQMLIHFFLMIFESSNDSSKLILEMMSTEAGTQIEEIFQLLLKAEPDMYDELGHLVGLAENWLIHWRGDSEERRKALEFVRLYMQAVKDKNYYMLPIQVRLHKLGSFIAGLKLMGKGANVMPPIRWPSYKISRVPSTTENRLRIGSPRVKPATHFSQVVANILCGRPCNDPLPKADVYADTLARNLFKNTLHGDAEFKTYTDKKYGNLYQKKELFTKVYPRGDSLGVDGFGDAQVQLSTREDCIPNLHCWIPKYTKSYVKTLEDRGCEVMAKADFEKGIKVKECRLGAQASCKDLKANFKAKKLYDWVRGPDGKVHRRTVGSYTELGATSSMSKIIGHAAGGHGGQRFGKKNIKTGTFMKAVSDTRLGRPSYSTKRSQTTRTSKGRYTNTAKSKELMGTDDRRRKSKTTGTGTVDVYKMDAISMDGSGDSGKEDGRLKREKATDVKNKTMKTTATATQKGELSKFRKSYNGPSNYKPRAPAGKSDTGSATESKSKSRNKSYKNIFTEKGFRNIFDKKNQKTQKHDSRRHFHGFKSGRYPLDGEWGGEDYSDYSPRDSDDYFGLFGKNDKDNKYKQENLELLSINQCWEKASKLFKKPSKALVIPSADNLMLYLQKKYSKNKWPSGDPIATRSYPNGSVFVAQFKNGSSKVYYPHGGLAVAISAPSPVTSQILVVRDPADHVYFFDKALLAEINSGGKGVIYGEDGVIKAQYSAIGGFKLDNMEKGQRWYWNHGGQRMQIKLNKYMSLRISDQDKIYLNFFGNHRGFLVNVASGHEVILMNPTSKTTRVDPVMQELKNLIRPKTREDNFDYVRGRFNSRPTLGFVDRAKHFQNAYESLNGILEQDKFRHNNNNNYFAQGTYRNDIYKAYAQMYYGGGGDLENCRGVESYSRCMTLNNNNNEDYKVNVNDFPITAYDTACSCSELPATM